jgi:hypothetical protein
VIELAIIKKKVNGHNAFPRGIQSAKMRIYSSIILLTASCLLFTAGPIKAHHGHDEYETSELIKLRGKVVGFELMDPHSLLYVDVENEDGTITSWIIEGGAAHGIVNAGLSSDSLAAGPTVIVDGYQSIDRNCVPRCRAMGRTFTFE